MFLNFIPTITKIFEKADIALYTCEPLILFDKGKLSTPFVFMKNQIVENNFRMIESYLPEFLLAFALVSEEPCTLNECIQKLSAQRFLNSNLLYSKSLLQCKMVTFMETLLFADIFNSVWNGDWESDKIYVYKNDTGLNYYHCIEIRKLLVEFLHKISIASTIKLVRDKHEVRIMFSLI